MKFFIYLISFILMLSVLGLFVLKQPNGQAWLTIEDFSPNTLLIKDKIKLISNELSKEYNNLMSEEYNNLMSEDDSQVTIYRWKDSNGNWSYSDKPIESTEIAEVIIVPKNIIVLPAIEPNIVSLPKPNTSEKNHSVSGESLPISPSKVVDLYNDANNVQKLIDARQQKMSKMIEDSAG